MEIALFQLNLPSCVAGWLLCQVVMICSQQVKLLELYRSAAIMRSQIKLLTEFSSSVIITLHCQNLVLAGISSAK